MIWRAKKGAAGVPIWEGRVGACIARRGPFAWCFVCPWVRKIVLLMPGTPQMHQKRQNMKKKNSPDLTSFSAILQLFSSTHTFGTGFRRSKGVGGHVVASSSSPAGSLVHPSNLPGPLRGRRSLVPNPHPPCLSCATSFRVHPYLCQNHCVS